MKLTRSLLLTLSLTSAASAWSRLGHEAVALLAQQYLLPSTKASAQYLLNDTSLTYLGNVASWADSFRSTPEGSFSGPLHYIDSSPDQPPPDDCTGPFYPRDCFAEDSVGCIVSAIANYTQRVRDPRLAYTQRQQALKFLVHFIGDIAQPLHTEGVGLGANTIFVNFFGLATNLHSIWDGALVSRPALGLTGNYSATNITDSLGLANSLAGSLNVGELRGYWVKAGWLRYHDLKKAAYAATRWAQESNKLVCTTVIPVSVASLNGSSITEEYYEKAVPVVRRQLAKAAIQLAGWLNLVFAGRTGFEGW